VTKIVIAEAIRIARLPIAKRIFIPAEAFPPVAALL
jgi:hypothetical protein